MKESQMEQLLKTLSPLALPGRLLAGFLSPAQYSRPHGESAVQASASQPEIPKKLFWHYFNEALSGGGRR
jgi:hypothetical protein